MSDIPKARVRLYELAELLEARRYPNAAQQLRIIIRECLYREKPVRKAPVTSKELTPRMAREIRAHAKGHPKESMQNIAAHFGVNLGRVSEALNRKI